METVIKCEKIKEWNGRPIYGIGLSDGQGGESFKEIPLGTPINELTITANPPYGNKIALKNPGAGGGGYSGGKKFGNESFALSYAKDVVIAGKVEVKNLFALADKMYDWLEKKKAVTAPSTPVVLASTLPAKEPAPIGTDIESDSLPF